MTARTPGKKSTPGGAGKKTGTSPASKTKTTAKSRAGKKTAPKTGPRTKTGTGGKAKTGTPAQSRTRSSSARAKTGTKAQARKPKKKSQKKDSIWTGYKKYLYGLTLGLLIGVLGAVILVYLPVVIKRMPPHRPQASQVREKSLAPKAKKAEAPVTKPETRVQPGALLYEEIHNLETQTKKLDQVLYACLQAMKIPEKDIDFLEVNHKTKKNLEWDHVLIEVNLPADLDPAAAVSGIQEALDKSSVHPRPRLKVGKMNGGMKADVYAGLMSTHTLHLLTPTTEKFLTPMESAPEKRQARPQTMARLPEKPHLKPPKRLPAGKRPKIAIIIDDFGQSLDRARCFFDLEIPVAFSVIPFLAASRQVAQTAHRKGFDVMLHMPMEPSGWPDTDAGPGVILLTMGREEIQARVRAALKGVPYVVGVNNHMGSRFTADRQHIAWALEEIRENNLFFVDSLTSTRSKAYHEARKIGLATARRSIFLDNVQNAQAIRIQLKKLVAQARRHGWAIGIGHVYPITCQVLKSEYNYLNTNAELVRVNSLVR